MLDEKTKKALKIIGIVFGAFVLLGIFNLFMGNRSAIPMDMTKQASFSMDSSTNSPETMGMGRAENVNPSVASSVIMNDSVMSEGGSESFEVTPADKKVIKNGNLSLKVEKTEKAAEEISNIVKTQGGEVFSTNFSERIKGQKSGSLVVKVPVQQFEKTMGELKKVATQVVAESTTGQDVSEQYADLQAQLKNKKAEEESFVKILERAGDIKDVLAVTQQVSRVRGEIERLEGRMKYMEAQTDMSTIDVSLSEDIEVTPISNDWRPFQIVKKSFSELIDNMQIFVDRLIRFAIVTLPALLIFSLIVWLIVIGLKKVYRKLFNGDKY